MLCPLCKSKRQKIKYKSVKEKEPPTYLCTDINKGNFGTIVQCQNCHLIFTDPQPTPKILKQKYSNFADQKYLKEKEARLINFRRDLKRCERYISGGKILDVGCLCGLSLACANPKRWERFGIDLNQWGIKYAQNKLGINEKNLYQGELVDAHYPSNFFDLITLWDVIEHLRNPEKILKEINRIAKTKGILALTTPNIASITAKIFQRKWWFLSHSHIYYFSPKTITALLNKSGFKIIQIKNYTRAFSLEYWFSKIKNFPLNNLILQLIKKLHLNKKIVRINTHDSIMVIAQKK